MSQHENVNYNSTYFYKAINLFKIAADFDHRNRMVNRSKNTLETSDSRV